MSNLVSIIIPTYRGADKIIDTLNGIYRQTYSNYEVLVVDDNGEGTEEQLKTAQALKAFPEVRYFVHPENRNGSAARNTGIRSAKGDFLAFLDDDDVWMDNKLEEQVARFSELDSSWGLVYSPYLLVQSEKEAYMIDDRMEGDLLFEFLAEKVHIACSTIMIRREVLEKVIGFDESFRRHQDWEFIARVAACFKIACAPGTLTKKYAIRRNSPKELEVLIRNRLYYLEKMKPLIESLSEEERKCVYDYHFSFLAKECIRRKRFMQCAKWLKKCNRPVKESGELFWDIVKYLIRKTECKTEQELLEQYLK